MISQHYNDVSDLTGHFELYHMLSEEQNHLKSQHLSVNMFDTC